jgi:CheY-like chemotaxis protein
MANILVLSDDEVMCALVKVVLEREHNDTVTAVSSIDQVKSFAQQQIPDLIVLEFVARIDDLDIGIPVYQQIRRIASLQQIPVLFWMVPNPTYTYPKAQELRVAGCVAMPSQPKELIEARDVILAGSTYYPPLK